MSNPFKAGDKITVEPASDAEQACARDTTTGKSYTLLEVDTYTCTKGKHDVKFIDDAGDEVHLRPESVTLSKE